uniref:G-protein coupled receptors family 3 profile domain-containing protein n=1 Tax=Anopheles merus TaxID=30066 RepID=A0A182VIR7_ANOME
MLRQCQFVLVALACFAANCSGTSSEYLIIRHGRSRVRHSSEKDHIRWGLQVFDNFTLLDYDAGGSGSGSGSEETLPARESQQGSNGGGGGSRGNTLTIRFDESEELERMIELSDFDNLRFGGSATPEPTARPGMAPKRKLIKKEIMENIRRTVDKGLEYLKSHHNLDEVKIELVPSFRDSQAVRRHAGKRIPSDTATIDSSNRAEEQSSSSSSAITVPTSSGAAAGRKPALPWAVEDDGPVAKSVQRSPSAQVSASNQRLISLDAMPPNPLLLLSPGSTQPPGVMDANHRSPYEWHRGSRVVSDGVDYPNDMPVADAAAATAVDTGNAADDEPEQEAEGDVDDSDGLLQDDDPLLQEPALEQEQEETPAEAPDAADINNVFHMEEADLSELDETSRNNRRNLMKGRDVVTQFLQIVESQHLLGANCTAGTALNLGEGVVDRYAQDRFRVEAEIAVNRANMLTRIFKFSSADVQASEHLLHASVLSMVEFDDDIFAGGNCFDWNQHPAKRGLFCPFAYRLPPPDQGASLVKDLALEYHYLGNTSEWFFLARKNAEKVIARNEQYIKSFHVYTNNTERQADEILSVKYEDGRWSKPYYDCGGGNIWMLTYTVPFFGYENGTYFFKGTSGIDIDLRRVDIDQCPQKNSPSGAPQPLNIFAGTDKCKQRTTECTPIPGLGFRRGSYRCICRKGYYFPDTTIEQKYFNGSTLEEEYEKLMLNEYSTYSIPNSYECLPCAEGCDYCEDASPCVAALNWPMRTSILVLACAVIGLLPPAAVFTFKYQQVKVVRAASPALLRVIALGAFCIYCTSVVMYPPPSLYSCTARIWLREIGFSLTYGALMLKTWRISVIFRVRSAKAVKITDAYLLKRIGVLCGFVGIALLVRTLVAPPVVIVGRTADNLKAFLCKTDWWDHTFTSLEVLFLAWGVRLCIMVRKAPSEFNESRFISMAIYNEFLLTCFLNVSMLFLQSPANPDLLYIIFFCHTQLTVTLLLALIFGSKVYLVFRGGGKHQDDPTGLGIKPSGAKFISRSHGRTFANASSVTTSTAQLGANMANEGRLTETEALEELKLLYTQLQRLYERIPQRGAAILTVASLMEACRTTSLRPPPALGAPSPLKAIQAAGPPDGLSVASGATGLPSPAPTPTTILRLDKSTNTNTTATIPNGSVTAAPPGNGSIVPLPAQTHITITDELDGPEEAAPDPARPDCLRSIDGSDFRLDHQQLQCMCSGDEEPALSRSMELTGRRNNSNGCCCSCACCASTRTAQPQQQQQQHGWRNDSVINNSTSAGVLTGAGSAVNCNCKISGVHVKSGSASGCTACSAGGRRQDATVGCAGPLHKAKQHSSELVLNCQFGDRSSGEHRKQQQQPNSTQQQIHPSPHHHQRASSTSECGEFSTKAFESCDNLLHQQQQQPVRQHQRHNHPSGTGPHTLVDSQATQTQAGVAGTLAQLAPATDEATIRSVNLEKFNKLYANNSSRIDSLKEHFLMRNALTTALQHLEIENRSRGQGGRARGRESVEQGGGGGVTEPPARDTAVRTQHEPQQQSSTVTPGNPVGRDEAINSKCNSSSDSSSCSNSSSSSAGGSSSTKRNNHASRRGESSSGTGHSAASPETSTAGGDGAGGGEGGSEGGASGEVGSTSTSGTKKKKSPDKRLVIDLNDRSKYTEEVSV